MKTADVRAHLYLDSTRAATLVPGGRSNVSVELLRRFNHLWKLRTGPEVYYLKAHTRPWYDWSPVHAASVAVRHECAAYDILRAHHLPAPLVIGASGGQDNALGWPYLLTLGLEGRPLPQVLQEVDEDDALSILHVTGAFLRRMHAIAFDHPGYLLNGPPNDEPNANEWQHPLWRLPRFLSDACAVWAADREAIGSRGMDEVMQLVTGTLPALQAAFTPPHFTNGDCHAGHVFIRCDPARKWEITGLIDMEVASSGCSAFDIAKFVIEMAGRFRARRDWWTALLAGYGDGVDLDVVRVILLAFPQINYTCYGDGSWPGSRPAIVRHLLRATSWRQLVDLDMITD